MTISEKIFKILDEEKISQKEFSIRTGIPQSTISLDVKSFYRNIIKQLPSSTEKSQQVEKFFSEE